MAALVGKLATVWPIDNWTLLFDHQPEPDLEFTEKELDQTIATKARGPVNPHKKPSGGSPILWVLLLILIGGITYVSMEPEMLTGWLSPYLSESTPTPPPMAVKPTPSTPALVVPATSPTADVPPVPPTVVPPPQAAASPAAPVAPSSDPMFSEGQKVTVTGDDTIPGGNVPLFADSSSSNPVLTIRPGISLTIMDGDLESGGWMYLVRTDEGALGWVSEQRLRLKF